MYLCNSFTVDQIVKNTRQLLAGVRLWHGIDLQLVVANLWHVDYKGDL